MNRDKLKTAIAEAERFLARAKDLQAKAKADELEVRRRKDAGETYVYTDNLPRENGATRRASMDLTRALADLRRTS